VAARAANLRNSASPRRDRAAQSPGRAESRAGYLESGLEQGDGCDVGACQFINHAVSIRIGIPAESFRGLNTRW